MAVNEEQNRRVKEQLLEVLTSGRAFAVTGAGVSVWAGYRVWPEVLRRLADRVQEYRGNEVNVDVILNNNTDPLHCAARLSRELGDGRFRDFLAEEFGPPSSTPHRIIKVITELPFRHFLTLNFDPSLEEVSGNTLRSLTMAQPPHLLPFLQEHDLPQYRPKVVHLHGLHSDPPNSIALTEDGYSNLYTNGTLQHFLWPLAATRRLVFLGCGFRDNDFNQMLRQFARMLGGHSRFMHFAVIGLKANENDLERRNFFREHYLIEPCFYNVGTANGHEVHDEFVPLIEEMAQGRPQPVPAAEPEAPVEAVADPGEVELTERLRRRLLERVEAEGDR